MTVSTMYDTSMDVKIFTFDLAGKCATTPGSLSEREEAWDDEEESRGDTGIWCLSACHCLPTEIFKL